MGDNGTNVEEGTHEELLKVLKRIDADGKPIVGPGLYHALWDTQQIGGANTELEDPDMQELQMKLLTQGRKLDKLRDQALSGLKFMNWEKHSLNESFTYPKVALTRSKSAGIG
jgi:hypothetical protein